MTISRRGILRCLTLMPMGLIPWGGGAKIHVLNIKDFSRVVSSYKNLQHTLPKCVNECINLESWHERMGCGGGLFTAVNSFIDSDDGGISVKVNDTWYWQRVVDNNKYSPEMFGAIGNGIDDDYLPIQNMLDSVPAFGKVYFDNSKIYYNDFVQDGGGAHTWTRTKPIDMFCNHALLTRRTPVRIGYNDNKSSILKFTGEGPFNIYQPKISGNNPIGKIQNHHFNETDFLGYAICQCQDFGIFVFNASKVNILDADISCCSFNIWIEHTTDIKVTGRLTQSGQVVPNITPSDLAYGAGIKLLNSLRFNIDVIGEYNTNATVEIEPNNSNGIVRVISNNNLSNGLVIYNSERINFEAYTKNTHSGNGTYIISNIGGVTKDIKGVSVTDGCSWIGTYIELREGTIDEMENVNIISKSTRCDNYGFAVNNASTEKYLRGLVVNYVGCNNGLKTGGYDVRLFGRIDGTLNGSIVNSPQGIFSGGEGNHLTVNMKVIDVKRNAYATDKNANVKFLKKN